MVYIFLANGFEETEAIAPADMLRRAGADVKIVGIGSKIVKSGRGIAVVADITESEAAFDNLEMIVLPGGVPGVDYLEESTVVRSFIEYANKNKLFIGAICAAPSVIGRMNVLNGYECTCYPGYEKELLGASVKDDYIVRDRNIITAKGAGVSLDFGLELVKALYGEEKSAEIKKEIQCR